MYNTEVFLFCPVLCGRSAVSRYSGLKELWINVKEALIITINFYFNLIFKLLQIIKIVFVDFYFDGLLLHIAEFYTGMQPEILF